MRVTRVQADARWTPRGAGWPLGGRSVKMVRRSLACPHPLGTGPGRVARRATVHISTTPTMAYTGGAIMSRAPYGDTALTRRRVLQGTLGGLAGLTTWHGCPRLQGAMAQQGAPTGQMT